MPDGEGSVDIGNIGGGVAPPTLNQEFGNSQERARFTNELNVGPELNDQFEIPSSSEIPSAEINSNRDEREAPEPDSDEAQITA